MAKRFIDTALFDDEWFMELSKEGKLFWIYAMTKCDHAGILQLNEKLCKFQTGIEDIETVKQELGNRIVTLRQPYLFIPKFLFYQYPNFPHSNAKAQKSAIDILTKFELFDKGSLTLKQGLGNHYGNGNDSDNGNGEGNGNGKSVLMRNSKVSDLQSFKKEFEGTDYERYDLSHYHAKVLNWSDSQGAKKKDWIATARNFMLKDKEQGREVLNPNPPKSSKEKPLPKVKDI